MLKTQLKNSLEKQQAAYESETELLLEKYDSITKEEKDSFIQRINEEYESFKVYRSKILIFTLRPYYSIV